MVDSAALTRILTFIFAISFGLAIFLSGIDIRSTDPVEVFRNTWAPVSAAATITSSLYFAFRFLLWRWGWFRPWLVRVPDLTGTWLARSCGEAFGSEPHFALVTIEQKLGRLTYRAWRKQSEVLSKVYILERVDQKVVLFVIYGNHVNRGARAEHGINHDGVLRLTLLNESDPNKWILGGEYWTNKQRSTQILDRGTTGTIKLTWNGRKLLSEDSEVAQTHFAVEAEEIAAFKARIQHSASTTSHVAQGVSD